MKNSGLTILMVFFSAWSLNAASAFSDLSTDQKISLFAEMKKDPFVPAGMNALFGFGTGSFAQRDIRGGLIGLCGDIVGGSLITTGFMIKNKYVFGLKETLTIGLGSLIYLSSRIYQIIRAGAYAEKYNLKLLDQLGLEHPPLSVSLILDQDSALVAMKFAF